MKLSEFTKPAPPVSPSACQEPGNASPEAPQEEQSTTTTTPSGIEIQYAWAPRRLYRLREAFSGAGDHREWEEVPSVTTVLGVLDKSGPLTWWGQGVGAEGVLELVKKGALGLGVGELYVPNTGGSAATKEEVVALLTEHKLTVNHVKDKAADRGVNVHGALEAFVEHAYMPNPLEWEEHEQGYIEGLNYFLQAILADANHEMRAELMVGSLQHQYAGRFDLVLTLLKPIEVVTKIYPKRKPRIEEIPAGRYLLDLKTSKRVYDTHYLQLEAYEAAAVECGYAPTDYRGVVHVTDDGRYELALNKDYCFEDFLAVRACYQVMNEREVLRVLREELDAEEV